MRLSSGNRSWEASLSQGIEISLPLHFDEEQPNAFFLPKARAFPFSSGSFIGDTRQGGSVNCSCVELSPHGNGTHTECVGHLLDQRISISSILPPLWCLAAVLSVEPCKLSESHDAYFAPHEPSDRVIAERSLQASWDSLSRDPRLPRPPKSDIPLALVLRTLTEDDAPPQTHLRYSGTNPVFLTSDAMAWIVKHNFAHLLVDLPSVDREEDAGLLPNHRIFWEVPLGQKVAPAISTKTITEMISLPPSIHDGLFLLHIEIPPFVLDAAPSRVWLFPLS